MHQGKQVAVDVAAGLHWLHSHRIVHFDVKSQNILLARDGTAKISDVGPRTHPPQVWHDAVLRTRLWVRVQNFAEWCHTRSIGLLRLFYRLTC